MGHGEQVPSNRELEIVKVEYKVQRIHPGRRRTQIQPKCKDTNTHPIGDNPLKRLCKGLTRQLAMQRLAEVLAQRLCKAQCVELYIRVAVREAFDQCRDGVLCSGE